jgi:hypothetical protein
MILESIGNRPIVLSIAMPYTSLSHSGTNPTDVEINS